MTNAKSASRTWNAADIVMDHGDATTGTYFPPRVISSRR